jgi:hypothetical protein
MNYLKITKYIYLLVGFIMLYDAYTKWDDTSDKPWLSLMLAGLAFFTYFFRRRFNKKFEDRNNQNQSK